ncbi:hypothetical protein Bca52824_031303 [Brassica carinata]|uniref:Uncharacterized protein n=1 Tax=Brassica carinata TaxID=52824 RepID=A0A8X7SB02_BRACI|nr:hypothetical protein Bca52824_031303 [Brassica carinata]
MNATKFVVLLIFVEVVCANVGARQLEEVSKLQRDKVGDLYVTAVASATNYEDSNASAAAGPGGPSADTSSTVSKSTYGYVSAEGPNASANSYGTAYGSTGANAAAGPNGAESSGSAYGGADSNAEGTTGP